MAQRSHVPAFGNWESEGNVPYTVFFDKARKGKGGGPMRNPNDPEEYPEMFSSSTDQEPPPSKPKNDTPLPAVDPLIHDRKHGRRDEYANSPARHDQYANSPGRRDIPGRSPLHKSSDGNRGKTKMKQSHHEDDTSEGTAVPKFGSWDVNNPASADGFTHIFGKVRDEKIGPQTPTHPRSSSPYNNNVHNQKPQDKDKGCCCFAWLRK